MKKDKILFLTAYVPNKAAAGEKNTMIMLNDLASTYDIDLIYYKYKWESEYIPEKANIRPIVLRNSTFIKLKNFFLFPFVHPTFSIRFDWSILRKIQKLTKENNYKVIILNHSNMFIYGKYLPCSIPRILLCHDVIAQRVMRSSKLLMQKLCIHSERFALTQPNTHIYSFSQKDCDLISHIYGIKADLCLDYIDEQILSKKPSNIGDYFILFGDWRRKENSSGALWFINNIGPRLNKKTTLKIIGRDFPTEKIKVSPNLIIENLGFVNDPYEIISNSKALISPLFHGAGIKVKVIEALACGTPVIGTDIAFEGLSHEFDSFMLLAKEANDYIHMMDTIDKSLDERLELKNRFIKSYQSETITQIINRL